MAAEEAGGPRGGGGVPVGGGRAERDAVLLPVHPHGGDHAPQTPVHHLPPISPATAQGRFRHQLVSFYK